MSGEQLKKILASMGVTQAELARQMDIPRQNVNYILTQKDVKIGIIENIAKALGKTLSDFVENAESKSTIENREFIQVLQNSQRQLDKSQEQIDRLLGIIEKMQDR